MTRILSILYHDFLFCVLSVVYLFSPVTLHSRYITLYLRYYILLNYIIQYIILCIILYIWAFSSSLTPFLCYSYSFEKRTIELPIVTRGKEDGHGPFFRSGYLFFFLREQKFWARTTFCIFRASPITLLRSRFPIVLFVTSFTLPIFIKQHFDAKHETMMALLFWLARFYIFGFFAAIKSPTCSSFPEISQKLPTRFSQPLSFSVPTIIFSRCTQPRIFQKLITNFWAQLLKDERKRTNFLTVFTGPNRNSLFVRCRWFFSPLSPPLLKLGYLFWHAN